MTAVVSSAPPPPAPDDDDVCAVAKLDRFSARLKAKYRVHSIHVKEEKAMVLNDCDHNAPNDAGMVCCVTRLIQTLREKHVAAPAEVNNNDGLKCRMGASWRLR